MPKNEENHFLISKILSESLNVLSTDAIRFYPPLALREAAKKLFF